MGYRSAGAREVVDSSILSSSSFLPLAEYEDVDKHRHDDQQNHGTDHNEDPPVRYRKESIGQQMTNLTLHTSIHIHLTIDRYVSWYK